MRSSILGLPVWMLFPGFNSRSGGTLRYPVVWLVLCSRAVSIRAHTRVQSTTVGRAVKQLCAPRWMRYSSSLAMGFDPLLSVSAESVTAMGFPLTAPPNLSVI